MKAINRGNSRQPNSAQLAPAGLTLGMDGASFGEKARNMEEKNPSEKVRSALGN